MINCFWSPVIVRLNPKWVISSFMIAGVIVGVILCLLSHTTLANVGWYAVPGSVAGWILGTIVDALWRRD